MEGYLQIWQGFIPHWNKYYFRIHEQLLIYGPNKEEIQGRVHLKIAQIISKLDDPISLMIHTGTETIEVRAFSIDEKVKWYKKLKEVQKQSIDSAHNKELFKMRVELSKVNRFKILDDLNTELWKCHAELEQRLEDLMEKVKNVQILKSIDRIRISVDEFKYKTSQILQYIDEEIRDMKAKDRDRSKVDSNSKRMNSNTFEQDYDLHEEEHVIPEDTQFFSFYGNPNRIKKEGKEEIKEKKLNKLSKIPEDNHSLSSLSIQLNKRKSRFETPKPVRHFPSKSYVSTESDLGRNRLKHKLFHQNKVYLKYTNILSPIQIRQSLPQKFTPEEKMSVVTTFLTAVSSGTDLTKISVPIAMNQPLSMLQSSCEAMLYADFLTKADDSNDESTRMLYITAFVVAGYSLQEHRLKRPFAPLLGETFEFVDEAKGYEYLSEQVSQQPPISACYIRSDNYQIFDNNKCKVSFTGNGIKVSPQSKTIIKLEKHNDFYVISKCEISLANIIFGKTAVEVFGEITIKCKELNTEVVLEFQEESFWKGTRACRIMGHLSNQGNKLYNFEGYWNKELLVENIVTKQKSVLWKKTHQVLRDYYNFNELSVQLNNLTASGYKNLPPTDSRFRPDQRALEFRDTELAAQQKQRLQQKQRSRRSSMQQQQKAHRMQWFKQSVLQGEDVFMSNQRYWDEKIKGMWKESPDIF